MHLTKIIYSGRSLNDERRIFNYRPSRARQTIDCTFGTLSYKLRVFHTPFLAFPDVAVLITKAACVLHNFVRRRDGCYLEDLVNFNMDGILERRGVRNLPSNVVS